MQHNNGFLFVGTTYLTVVSWGANLQPFFSIGASIGAMGLAAFGMINYWKKWNKENEKQGLD